jgi:hypothetical protein
MAAFRESYFLHRFIGDFQHHRDDPTFLAHQREKLTKYDAKKDRARSKQIPPTEAKAASSPAPLPRPRTPTPPPKPERLKVKVVSPARPAVAGPGPQTIANSSRVSDSRRPSATSFGPGKVREPLPEYRRSFKDIEESGSDSEYESEVVSGPPPLRPRPVVLITKKIEKRVEKKEKRKEERKKDERKKEVKTEKEKKDETAEKETVVRVKRAVIPRKSDADAADDSTHSEDSDEDEDARPYKAPVKHEYKVRPIVATGKLYARPCARCEMAEKECEIQEGGTACVACRRSKNKCEYGQPRKKVEKKKSKAIVETEDDLTEGGRQHPPRRAAKAANAAIENIITGKTAPKAQSKAAPQPAKKGVYSKIITCVFVLITF